MATHTSPATRPHWTQTPEGKRRLAQRRSERRGLNGTRTRQAAHDLTSAIRAHIDDEDDTSTPEEKPIGLRVRSGPIGSNRSIGIGRYSL